MLNNLLVLFISITDSGVAVGPSESQISYTGACPQGIDITSIYYDYADEWIALTSSGKIIGNAERRDDPRMDIIPAELTFQSICGGLDVGSGILDDTRVFWWDCRTSPPQTGFTGHGFTALTCTNEISVGLKENGSIEYIGSAYAIQSQPEIPAGESFRQVIATRFKADDYGSCQLPFFGLTTDGRLRIWGAGSDLLNVSDNTQTDWQQFAICSNSDFYCSGISNFLQTIGFVGIKTDGTTSTLPQYCPVPFEVGTNVAKLCTYFNSYLNVAALLEDGSVAPQFLDLEDATFIDLESGGSKPGRIVARDKEVLLADEANYRDVYTDTLRWQTVLLSEGQYTVDTQLSDSGQATIQGVSAESAIVNLSRGSEGRPVSLKNCTVKISGDLYYTGNIYLENCVIESDGGSFYQDPDADDDVSGLFFAKGCTFLGFESSVVSADGSCIFENCVFDQSAIYAGNGTVKIVSCSVNTTGASNKCVVEAGGDLFDSISDFHVDCYNTKFSNLDGVFGTVFRCSDPIRGTIRNVDASDCESLFGGAIWLDDTKATLENCSFDLNNALEGSAIYAQGDTQLNLSNCTFTSNTGSPPIRLAYSNALVADCFMGYNDGCWDLTSSLVQTQNSIYCENNPDFENPFVLDLGDNTVSDNCSELDCNQNGIVDLEEIESGAELDCNQNNIPDSCDIDSGFESDCNSNQIPDSCDIGDGLLDDCDNDGNADLCIIQESPSEDSNSDGILDRCQCITDINNDGYTDFKDLLQLLSCWGSDPSGVCSFADVSDDANIDFSDLIIMLSNFGPC